MKHLALAVMAIQILLYSPLALALGDAATSPADARDLKENCHNKISSNATIGELKFDELDFGKMVLLAGSNCSKQFSQSFTHQDLNFELKCQVCGELTSSEPRNIGKRKVLSANIMQSTGFSEALIFNLENKNRNPMRLRCESVKQRDTMANWPAQLPLHALAKAGVTCKTGPITQEAGLKATEPSGAAR